MTILYNSCYFDSTPTNGWDCGDYLPQFELVEDCCFSCSVEPYHQDPHLLLPYEALQQIPENIPHDSEEVLKLQRVTTILILDVSLQSFTRPAGRDYKGGLKGNRTNNHLEILNIRVDILQVKHQLNDAGVNF